MKLFPQIDINALLSKKVRKAKAFRNPVVRDMIRQAYLDGVMNGLKNENGDSPNKYMEHLKIRYK